MMTYSLPALQMLDRLGISVQSVLDRNLQECVEARVLDVAEVDAHGREHVLQPDAAQAWRKLKADARLYGTDIYLVSAFRSVERQAAIIKRKLDSGLSIETILSVSAPPFFSEHHTGCAVDIGTPGSRALEREFEETQAFEWLTKNAHSFGFYLSYPINNAKGFAYEPWHWRYMPQ